VNAIDFYTLSIVAVTTATNRPLSPSASPHPPPSPSVAAAERALAAMTAQMLHAQRSIAALERRRRALPVTDPQEPRLRREMKAAKGGLADLQNAHKALHRECAAAVGGGDCCRVVAEVALDARSAMSMEFNLTIPASCTADSLADLHLSALVWPEAVRDALSKAGVCVYSSDLAVVTSAVGHVVACAQGSVVRLRGGGSSSSSSMQGASQTIDLPNSIVALAMNHAGTLVAAAVPSITGGRLA